VTKLKRSGWYGTVLYTFAKKYQLAARYEEFDRDVDSATDNKLRILTGGFHYFIKGNNANLKLNVESIEDDGRSVGGVLDEKYLQAVVAAQISF
jgi:Phosphate-selective porin O and P.